MSMIVANGYFDGKVLGPSLLQRQPVVVAITSNVALSAVIATAAFDGVTLVANDRVLLTGQTTATQNGIYRVVDDTNPAVRDDDFQTGYNAGSIQVPILKGTVGTAAVYLCTNAYGSDVVGTNNLTFVRSVSGTVAVSQGGTGLTSVGTNKFLSSDGSGAVVVTKDVPTGVVVGTTDTQVLSAKTLRTDTVFENGSATGKLGAFGTTNIPSSTTVTLQFPSANGTIATEAYVNSFTQGLSPKESVVAASTANINLSNPGTATFDGIALSTGDRILVKNQTTTSQNGIYVFDTSSTALTRATDMDATNEADKGSYVFITYGTAHGATGWIITTGPATVGTDPLLWTQFSSAGTYVAGNGISISGSTFSANLLSNGGLVFNGSQLQVDLAASSISGTVATTHGGTGLTSFTNNTFLTASSTSALASSKVVPTGDVLGTTDTQTLTNKTLTSAKFNLLSGTGGNTVLTVTDTGSANYFDMLSAATSGVPVLSVAGSDSNISLALKSKGTGLVTLQAPTSTKSAELQWVQSSTAGGFKVNLTTNDASMVADISMKLPPTVGSAGQALITDGSGTLSFSNRRVNHQLFCSQAYADTTTAKVVSAAYFTWINSRHSVYASPVCVFYASNLSAADLTVEVYNVTTSSIIGTTTTSGTSSAAYSFSFTKPTADALLVIRVLKSASGTVHPIVSAVGLEFNMGS